MAATPATIGTILPPIDIDRPKSDDPPPFSNSNVEMPLAWRKLIRAPGSEDVRRSSLTVAASTPPEIWLSCDFNRLRFDEVRDKFERVSPTNGDEGSEGRLPGG